MGSDPNLCSRVVFTDVRKQKQHEQCSPTRSEINAPVGDRSQWRARKRPRPVRDLRREVIFKLHEPIMNTLLFLASFEARNVPSLPECISAFLCFLQAKAYLQPRAAHASKSLLEEPVSAATSTSIYPLTLVQADE